MLRTALITFTFPPPDGFRRDCRIDFVPLRLLEWRRPPLGSCSVMLTESPWPPAVESVISTVSDMFPPRLIGLSGFVMFVRFAFVLKFARFPTTTIEFIALLLI